MSGEQEKLKEAQDDFVSNLVSKHSIIGRPPKAGSGTTILSASIPYGYRDLMIKYKISASAALQEGILMMLNIRDDFPDENSKYEMLLKKGIFVDKRQKFADILSKKA